jgi:hypothetical protein
MTVSCVLLIATLIAHECNAQKYQSRRDSSKRGSGKDGRQEKSQRKGKDPVRIGRLIGTGQQTEIKTPQFKTRSQGNPTAPEDWVQITVEYDTFPDWIDSLTFKYEVLTLTREGGEKMYGLYRKTVEYRDVEKDRDHLSTVFLRPATVKRFGLPVAVHVEIFVDGELVVEENEKSSAASKVPPDWWTNSKVLNSPTVKVRDGLLLNRNETPFAMVDIDSYEVIR